MLIIPLRSIVIIHGLDGDATQSWTNPDTKAFWPKDFLPLDIPEGRVLNFGYNAVATFGNTTADIVDHAKDLLSSLVDKREEEPEKTRPIIFIAHSLGGIVVKQVCVYTSISALKNYIDTFRLCSQLGSNLSTLLSSTIRWGSSFLGRRIVVVIKLCTEIFSQMSPQL